MDVRKLNAEEMGQVSLRWVTPGAPARLAIESRPMLSPLLAKLQLAHDGVITAVSMTTNAEARKLMAQATALDDRHDELVMVLYEALTVLAKTTKDPERILRILALVLPQGLQHVNFGHRAEAGHADYVAKQMTGDVLAQMKALAVGERTVFDIYQEWQTVAGQLGEVTAQRALLSSPVRSQATQLQSARREWARWVSLFLETARHIDLDPGTDDLLFAGLRAAVQSAKGRWRSQPSPEPPVPAPATGSPAA